MMKVGLIMESKDIIKAQDILDKFDFFNQRAGYELWNNKPKNIQDKDIKNKAKDIKFLKGFINQQQAEIEKFTKRQKPTGASGYKIENGKVVFFTNMLGGYREEKEKLEEVVKT